MAVEQTQLQKDRERNGFGAYFSLIFACIFFSGVLQSSEWWGVFDFSTLKGAFGKVVVGLSGGADGTAAHAVMGNFRGRGGNGAFDGFMFALTLFPAVMFAIGMVTVFEHYGALKAAGRMMTPIMRPILGLPGVVVLSLITTLQAIDAGAAMTKGLEETKQMTHIEVLRSTAFQITSGGCLTNFFSSGAVLFTLVAADGRSIPLTMGFTFLVILACKFINSFIMRLITLTAFKNH